MTTPNVYHRGIRENLLLSLNLTGKKVLEVGCGSGEIARLCKQRFAGVVYVGVDCDQASLDRARPFLDELLLLSSGERFAESLLACAQYKRFDLIILGDLLDYTAKPLQLLDELLVLAHDQSLLLLNVTNSGSIEQIGQLATGDIAYGNRACQLGSWTADHTLPAYTPSSVVKLLLDAGWLPNMHEGRIANLDGDPRVKGLLAAASGFDVSHQKLLGNLSLLDATFIAIKSDRTCDKQGVSREGLSVIVPVNKKWQYDVNVAISPGLKEIDAEIIVVSGASSAAEAFEAGAAKASHQWRMMIHQDVYIPSGSGFLVLNELHRLREDNSFMLPIGFFGGEYSSLVGKFYRKGLVVDRVYPNSLLKHDPSAAATTLDELAIILHADSPFKIDSALGWHLWATDLCLQAELHAGRPSAQIICVPVFHNSIQVSTPVEWQDSSRYLASKWPGRLVPTLNGVVGQ